ncbi:MAG: HIT domain-containing protein, partial [Anaerolineae bacterium]
MPDCLFCNMAQGKMAVDKLYEDDLVFAIRDINPRAPVHFMVI